MLPPTSIRECRVPLSKRRWGAGLIGTFKDVDLIRQFCSSCPGIEGITANSQWKVLWEQLNICCIFLFFPMQAGAPQTAFNWCQDFLSFTIAAPITLSAALFYLAISPLGLCIPHLWSVVESSKPLFGSDTSSQGEVIPKLFSSQKNSGYVIFQTGRKVCFLLWFPLSGKNLWSLFCVKEAVGFYLRWNAYRFFSEN